MKNLLNAVVILVLGMGAFRDAQIAAKAQAPSPTPPAAVVSEARRVAQQRGVALAPTPDGAELWTDNTGFEYWDLTWEQPHKFVSVYLDQHPPRAWSFFDVAVHEAYAAARERGDVPAYTYTDAVRVFDVIFAELSPPPGDWHFEETFSSAQMTPAALVAKNWQWEIVKRLVHDGVKVDNMRVSVSVDPFTGSVISWGSWTPVVFSATPPSYYGWEWASNTAKDAAAQYWEISTGPGPYFTSPPSARNLSWLPVSDNTTLNGLFYTFYFSRESNPLFGVMAIQVTVDAVSGEVVYCGWIQGIASGGSSSRYKLPALGARRKLLLALLTKTGSGMERNPLVRALVSGKPAFATKPRLGARRFERQVHDKPVRFAFNVARRRLTWQVGPTTWAGVAVTKPDADALTKELERAVGAR